MVQRQIQSGAVEEEPSYYEEDSQETYEYQENYAEEVYAEESEQSEYAGETYVQEAYEQEEVYAQENYNEQAQYVYADEDNNEYAYYEGNTYAGERASEPYVGSAYAEPVQKQTTGSMDMSQYNTINLQKVVAESMRELFPDDED
ncbi:MAG: hypothetical protein J6A59_08565, partial [Lachnospiraceae bacterium]|nr:hypothetical protein [Lachnospiraceae bacterium]